MKTPMQELIDKFEKCTNDIEPEFSNGEINQYNSGYREALLSVIKDLKAMHEYASQASTVDDESAKEPIQSALYATNKFTVDDCSVLSEGILQYIKDAGYSITSNEYVSQGAEAVDKLIEYFEQQLGLQRSSKIKYTGEEAYFDALDVCRNTKKILHQPSSRHLYSIESIMQAGKDCELNSIDVEHLCSRLEGDQQNCESVKRLSSSEMGLCRFCGGSQCDSDSHK